VSELHVHADERRAYLPDHGLAPRLRSLAPRGEELADGRESRSQLGRQLQRLEPGLFRPWRDVGRLVFARASPMHVGARALADARAVGRQSLLLDRADLGRIHRQSRNELGGRRAPGRSALLQHGPGDRPLSL